MYLLALNCGSSSIKGKLYGVEGKDAPLKDAAKVSMTNIGASGDPIKVVIKWKEGVVKNAKDVDEERGDGGNVEHRELFPVLLDHLSKSGIKAEEVKYITHRIVHGGENKKGLVVTSKHSEALEQMDALSEFAPLHNHHSVLCVRACLEALPESTQLLYFDTLFHQTLPPEVYTYALPPPTGNPPIPLRKYGFHGLSYASIVHSLSRHFDKPESELNIVAAHLGSGASAACIKGGKSIDTSMGLTPLEGLVGGTRTGDIDPTAIFHHTPDYWKDAGLEGMKVSKGEYVMNKESGLVALAGTPNFGTITQRAEDSGADEHARCQLAYGVYVDHLMGYLTQYIAKLLVTTPLDKIVLVFAGGIGEHAAGLRSDVLARLHWLGAQVDDKRNSAEAGDGEVVREISNDKSRVRAYVVQTDEEGWCAHLAREQMGP